MLSPRHAPWIFLFSFAGCFHQAVATETLFDFQARSLVAISDADMVASAYADGDLGNAQGRDALTLIQPVKTPNRFTSAAVEVSNSVVGSPAVVAVTPDGRFAVVVETLKQRQKGDTRLNQLKPGRDIVVVDLLHAGGPRVIQKIEAPGTPGSIAINAAGDLLAVPLLPGADGVERPLLLYPIVDGVLGTPTIPELPGWQPKDRLMDASFHPTQDILVLLNQTKETLSFVRLERTGSSIRAMPWGNVVGIDRAPYLARFTPDGRHVITNATYSGPDILDGGFGAPLGTLISIRVNHKRDAQGGPVHVVISRAQTGVGPEGFTISPNGRWVVSTNLERTPLPFDDPRLTPFSSLSLLAIDPESGVLERIGDYPYDGILPESVVFDNSSQYLAVANFDHFDQRNPGGSVDFWRLAIDPMHPHRRMLVKMSQSVPVARGAHTLAIIR